MLDHTLRDYMKKAGEYPLLSHEEEIILADRTDQKAKEKLVNHNLRLVMTIAKRYRGRGLHFADLIEEGNIGLVKASRTYDSTHETRFSTYAAICIKRQIKREIFPQIPVHISDHIPRYNEFYERHISETGREPSIEEIAKDLDISEKCVRNVKEALRKKYSTISQDEEGEYDSLGTANADFRTPLESLGHKDDCQKLAQSIKRLSYLEQLVIESRFGLNGFNEHTLDQIGENILPENGYERRSKERIRQITVRVIDDLRWEFGLI